jgi:NADPH:quinone reductase
VGGDVRARSFTVLAEEGTLVIYGIAGTGRFEAINGDQLAGMYMKCQSLNAFSLWSVIRAGNSLRSGLEELFALSTEGRITTLVGHRYPLSEGRLAHEALQARNTVGKVLLTP